MQNFLSFVHWGYIEGAGNPISYLNFITCEHSLFSNSSGNIGIDFLEKISVLTFLREFRLLNSILFTDLSGCADLVFVLILLFACSLLQSSSISNPCFFNSYCDFVKSSLGIFSTSAVWHKAKHLRAFYIR